MAALKIELLGSEALRKPAAEVDEIDDQLRMLIQDMFETMYEAEGIGLAGPQVGVGRRVIVVDVRQDGREPFALVNPRVVERGTELAKAEEGCLSIPGVSALVERVERVAVEGLNESGQPVRVDGDGLLARCLLHEIDHLDGVLFIDHLSPLKRKMLLKKYKTLRDEALAAERGSRAGG
jgi:peptide deformylase